MDGAILRRAVRADGGGDRAVDGLPQVRLPPAGDHGARRRELPPRDGVHALGRDDQGDPVRARGCRPRAVDADRRRGPRVLDAGRGAGQPGRRDDVDRQGRRQRGVRIFENTEVTEFVLEQRPSGRRRTERGDDRVREGRARRGAVGARAGGQGRGDGAAAGRRALLPAHRAHRRRRPRSPCR